MIRLCGIMELAQMTQALSGDLNRLRIVVRISGASLRCRENEEMGRSESSVEERAAVATKADEEREEQQG